MIKPENQYHVGIIVDDFDAALTELSAVFGYEWTTVMAVPTLVRMPDGNGGTLERTIDAKCCYSLQEPRIEIVQSHPGTVWEQSSHSAHHFGFWSDDVLADSAELAERGYTEEVAGLRPDGSVYWTYYRAPSGMIIELVSRDLQGPLESLWTTPGS